MSKSYGAEAIKVMKGLEAIQHRPAMYIGNSSTLGLHHIVLELLSNSIDEYARGVCSDIFCTITKDGYVIVSDNGGGIPVSPHEDYPTMSTLTVLCTIMHSTGKLDSSTYEFSIGLHGIGLKAACALSDDMEVEVHRDGKKYRQRFSYGKVLTALEEIGTTRDTGTIIKFKPSKKTFKEDTEFKKNILADFMLGMAYITKGCRMHLHDERDGYTETFYSEGGLPELLTKKLKESNKSQICKTIHMNGIGPGRNGKSDDKVEIVMCYDEKQYENIVSYVNFMKMVDGGTQVTGFKTGLTRIINKLARQNGVLKDKDRNFEGSEITEGLYSIISIKMSDPEFEGQTKNKLNNPEIISTVAKVLSDSLETYLLDNPKEADKIFSKILHTRKIRDAIKRTKDALSEGKGRSMVDKFTGKLAPCSSYTKIEDRELLIVEGDSAGGSAKQGRDTATQSVLPLKGKIINVEKNELDKIMKNEEVRSLINAIGGGFLDTFDLNKVQYGKVIILTDSDIDG